MAAWRDHYPIDLHPGFWECLAHYSQEGRLLSVDRVRTEILSPDALTAWVDQYWGDSFAFSGEDRVVDMFKEMQTWVQTNQQFRPAAKDEFAGAADGWLAAYAKVHDAVVVTNEVADPEIRRRVPIPNLCQQFNITYDSTVGMLRRLGVRFDLRRTT